MRKALCLLLFLLLVSTLAVSALATAGTEITTDSGSGNTNLRYAVGIKYWIVIPPTISITGGSGSGSYGVAAGSLITAGKDLAFTITGATNYAADPGGSNC